MPRYALTLRLLMIILSLLSMSCQQAARPHPENLSKDLQKTASAYLAVALSEDTLSKTERLTMVRKVLGEMQTQDVSASNWYCTYFKAHELELSGQKDSAMLYYRILEGDTSDAHLYSLVQYGLFSTSVGAGEVVGIESARQLLEAIKIAEQNNSFFLYRLYDLLAKSYYTQKNIRRSIEYTNLYFKHHPLCDHPLIRQRYYDISFMLASVMEDRRAMRRHLDSARSLALITHDTMALMRTYDYEAQVSSYDDPQKAVELSRKFFNYLKSEGKLQMYAFANMATTFEKAGLMDSAVYYYKEATRWAKLYPEVDLSDTYESLSGVYIKQGHYREAVQALDSALKIFTRNTHRVQAEKIEELKARYQAEKKDQAIASLQQATNLNRRIILQQRWFFAGGMVLILLVSLYFYNNYRRRLLLEKNEKLSADNKRLRLEQKTLQLQLNPHFIYNSIANLQGLISQGEQQEASTYLSAFSQLMRSLLELNREELIPLREEIQTLESYIRLQQMRFRDVFEYRIETEGLEPDDVLIPPMLVQPLVENAIEHGFKGMAHQGRLWIKFTQSEHHLEVSVTDNGQGSPNNKGPVKKSLAQSITRERLDVLFNREGAQAFLETEQHPEAGIGYRVTMMIPLVHV